MIRTEAVVAPGVRVGINLPGRLQIVPGIAALAGVGPSAGRNGAFGYLSVELPFFSRLPGRRSFRGPGVGGRPAPPDGPADC